MKTVESLGYTPNFGARAMAAKRTFTIGAIIPTMENAIFARGLQAFQEELHTRGYTLLVSSTAYKADAEAEQIKTLVSRGADGLLLIGFARDPVIYDFLRRRGVPTMIAWAVSRDSDQSSIGFDNRASMHLLTDHVIAAGHQNIAMVSGISQGNDRAAERIAGVRDALSVHGRDPNALPIIETGYDIENGADAFEQLMQADARPTVVMCGNDVLAVGAMRRARDLGLRVPDDVSITGFDDIELARIVTPTLTTIHVPHREMGRRAAFELVKMLEGGGTGPVIELESTLCLRDSLAPPKTPKAP